MAFSRSWEKSTAYNVYIDESSQTKMRYLVLGGLVIPKPYDAQLESAILGARGSDYPAIDADGRHSMKWAKAKGRNDLEAYKRIFDAFFYFPLTVKMPMGLDANIHCIAVDMTKRDDKKYSFGDADIGFSKEVNCLAVSIIGRKYRLASFHLYPDRRNTNQSLTTALNIMNHTCAQFEDETRFVPFRSIDWAECENIQALQVVDIVIGAIAYRLNGHYEKPEANKTKKLLCDHILKKARITDVTANSPYHHRRITLFHRNFSPFETK